MLFESEKKELLKGGKNAVYVWSGCGYTLDKVTTDRDELSIEELAFICIKSNKGMFLNMSQIDEDTLDEMFESDIYVYCDMSSFGLENGFLLIENLRCEGVEVHS